MVRGRPELLAGLNELEQNRNSLSGCIVSAVVLCSSHIQGSRISDLAMLLPSAAVSCSKPACNQTFSPHVSSSNFEACCDDTALSAFLES